MKPANIKDGRWYSTKSGQSVRLVLAVNVAGDNPQDALPVGWCAWLGFNATKTHCGQIKAFDSGPIDSFARWAHHEVATSWVPLEKQ